MEFSGEQSPDGQWSTGLGIRQDRQGCAEAGSKNVYPGQPGGSSVIVGVLVVDLDTLGSLAAVMAAVVTDRHVVAIVAPVLARTRRRERRAGSPQPADMTPGGLLWSSSERAQRRTVGAWARAGARSRLEAAARAWERRHSSGCALEVP